MKGGAWVMERQRHFEGKRVKPLFQETRGTETVISQRLFVDLDEMYGSLLNVMNKSRTTLTR